MIMRSFKNQIHDSITLMEITAQSCFTLEGVDRGGGGTGIEGAESGVEGAESREEVRNQG